MQKNLIRIKFIPQMLKRKAPLEDKRRQEEQDSWQISDEIRKRSDREGRMKGMR